MPPAHGIRQAALARISCICGWFWRNDFLKGKTDLELEAEAQQKFKEHLDER